MLWKNFHVLSDDSEYECSTSQIHLFGVCTYPIHHYLDATTGEHKQKKLVKMILESSLLGRRLLRSAAILFNFLTFPPLRCIYLCFFSRCRLWLVDSFKANYILKKKIKSWGLIDFLLGEFVLFLFAFSQQKITFVPFWTLVAFSFRSKIKLNIMWKPKRIKAGHYFKGAKCMVC